MVDFVIIDVIFTIVTVRFCGPTRKFRAYYLEHTLRGLANAAENKGMYQCSVHSLLRYSLILLILYK